MSDKKLPDYFEFYAAPKGTGDRFAMSKASDTWWTCHKIGEKIKSDAGGGYTEEWINRYLSTGAWRFAEGYGYVQDLPEEFDFHTGNPQFLYHGKIDGHHVSVTWNHFGDGELNRTVYRLEQVKKNLASGAWFLATDTKTAAKRVVELVKEDLKDKPTYPKLKEGDKVRVARRVEMDDPDGMGVGLSWDDSWTDEMDDAVGRVATVLTVKSYGFDLKVEGPGNGYSYPLKALELAEKAKPVERSFDRRLELRLEDGYYRAYDDECQAMADAKHAYDNASQEVKAYEGFLQKKKDALEEARKALERFKVT